MNPYVAATVGLGVKAFGNKVNLSGAVEARVAMGNPFNAQAAAAFTSKLTKVKFAPPSDVDSCPNGAWFASTFDTTITASGGGRVSMDLLDNQLPVFKPACWTTPGTKDTPGAKVSKGNRSSEGKRKQITVDIKNKGKQAETGTQEQRGHG